MDVVEQVPARVIGVLIDGEVVATIPAPLGGASPVPRSDFKVEAAGEPDAMVVTVNASNGVTVVGAKVFKMTVFERMILVKALIVGLVVAVPVIVVDMLRAIDLAVGAMLGLRSGVGVALLRRRRDVRLICAWSTGTVSLRPVLYCSRFSLGRWPSPGC